ncbi:MAG: hypothetical protein E6J34_13285 [Chloroflexi bacterium]|nr:MAG: hypothetical protein E6J34_13285 [Chloroflexota bacterium]
MAYAVGCLGAFGAFTGFALPATRLRLWIVTLACGSLQARTRYGDLLTQIQINLALQEEVAHVLEQHFGLSGEERKQCIEQYADDYFARMKWT